MSAWPSQQDLHFGWSRLLPGKTFPVLRVSRRATLWLGCLICALAVQGIAITQSYLWAAPAGCLLVVALATDIPIVPFLGLTLTVRVLTDDLASSTSRHSASLSLSSLIAGLFILVAVGLMLRRRQAVWPALLAAVWLCLWTAIAIKTDGASTVTVREGVREASIVAVAIIAFNARGGLSLSAATRLIQLAGIVAALLALYQLATHSGQSVGGEIRSNGTFAQPNAAAVFFAVAAMASLWRFLNDGRRRSDAAFVAVFAAATISTFSLGGLACLLVMLIAFGLLRPGSFRLKVGTCAVAGLVIVAFLATPLGQERIASESATSLSSSGHLASTSSLAWRFEKWKSLLPEWERAPFFGQGLGTTTTSEGTSENNSAALLPHSEVVRYLVETGALGFVTLVGGVGFLLSRLALRRAIPGTGEAGILGIGITLGLLVNGLAANTVLYTAAAYAAALIVGAALSASSVPRPLRP